MVEDRWLGGLASPVYKVTIKRVKKTGCSETLEQSQAKANYFPKTRPIDKTKVWKCPTCGHLNSLSDEYCVKCLTNKAD